MGLWAPLWLSLYFLPELSCRCSHLWSYLPAGPQIYPIDRYLSSWMGWGPLVHTILSAWQVLDSYSCLFFSPVCGLVSFSSWQEHLDGPWIRFIACHFRGCQSCLWLEVGPTFTERATHWDMLKFFFQSKGSASLIQGLKEKVNSSISLFKGWFGCLSTRQGSSVGVWCGKPT